MKRIARDRLIEMLNSFQGREPTNSMGRRTVSEILHLRIQLKEKLNNKKTRYFDATD